MNAIFQAIRLNDSNTYKKLISSATINIVNDFAQNLLQEAIASERTHIANDLIERGIDVNHIDIDGQTALHFCGLYKNFEIVEAILLKGGDLNIVDIYGKNALWTSVFNARGDFRVVKLLVTYGANIESKNKSNRSPLDFAKQINSKALIEVLEKKL